jgi:hypothetical protein
MSLSCWRALGYPELVQSNTMLKEYDGHVFKPYGIIFIFLIELGGKIVSNEVKVVDTPLDYNLLLLSSWFYAMMDFVSLVFRLLHFTHDKKLFTIN